MLLLVKLCVVRIMPIHLHCLHHLGHDDRFGNHRLREDCHCQPIGKIEALGYVESFAMESTGNGFEGERSEKKHWVTPPTDEKARGRRKSEEERPEARHIGERKSVLLVPSKRLSDMLFRIPYSSIVEIEILQPVRSFLEMRW